MSNSEDTQLTPANGYDTSRMIFSEPVTGTIPDSKLTYKRINISTKNDDGTVGELVIPTGRLFSYGVSENTSQETGSVNGYTFPLCLWDRDGPTPDEKAWTDTFGKIIDKCITHLLNNKEEIDKLDLDASELKKFNPLYWKREKYTDEKTKKTGLRIVPGTGPTLYTKLIFSKKNDKFITQFFDTNDEPLNALDLLGKYCYTNAAVKIESVFIGNKISMQIKLYEAVVEPTQQGMKRLLARPKANSKVLAHKPGVNASAPPMDEGEGEGEDGEGEDGEGSLNGDSDDVIDDGPSVTSPATKVKTVPSRPLKKVPVRRPAAK